MLFDIIDFDANFQAYTQKWLEMNKDKFADVDQMEDAMPGVYMRWLNTPAAFLEGGTPAAYFDQFDSAPELVKWVRLYDQAGVNVPDLLLDRISQLGSASIKPLVYTATNAGYSVALRMTALNLLKEVETEGVTADLCFDIIDNADEGDELAETAAELLANYAQKFVPQMIEKLDTAGEFALETYLDLLCNYPGDERIYTYLLKAFEKGNKYALYASLLGKLGDDRAIEPLTKALDYEDINYLDYIEIRNSIEMLGGECVHEREFAGDEFYESLKNQ